MTSKSILNVFDTYQKARLCFVQNISDISLKKENTDVLQNARILDLLKPLLTDPCSQIQQCAAISLGRLVMNNATIARRLLESNFMPLLLTNIHRQSKHQKKSTLFVLRAICKHNAEMALNVVNAGGLQTLAACLEDFETAVKESASWGVGYIARHNEQLARACVDAGVVPLLILCVQEPDLSLKQVATSALSDIAKHNIEMAHAVVDLGAVPHLARNLNNLDEKLKRQVLCALSSCAKHSTEIAEFVVEAEVFPSVLLHLGHPCQIVRRNAAILVREIVKHSLELAQLVVNTGGIGALVEVINQSIEDVKIPCITGLGYIAGHSDQLALSVLGCKVVIQLAEILTTSKSDGLMCVTAWTLGQIGKHSPEHSQAIAQADVFSRLNEIYINPASSEDLKCKTRNTLKLCLQKCLLVSTLEPLLFNAPPNILKYVLGQYSKVLPEDPKARRLFVTSGGLKKVQEIEASPGTTLLEYKNVINSCFPDEIVRFYSPGYSDSLLEKVEQYSPQLMTVLREKRSDNIEAQTDLSIMADDQMECEDLNNLVNCNM